MASRLFFCLLSCICVGCASGNLPEEALPLAEAAAIDINELDEYLAAAGANVTYITEDRNPPQRQGLMKVERIRFFEFSRGGQCSVLVYESAAVAKAVGPREGGGGGYARRTRSINSGDFVEIRSRYKPTYLFGPYVAVCSGESALVKNAMQHLVDLSQEPS